MPTFAKLTFSTQHFNSKLNKENVEFAKDILKKLDSELESEYVSFKSKNGEKERAYLVCIEHITIYREKKYNYQSLLYLYVETTKRKGTTRERTKRKRVKSHKRGT